MRQACCQVFKLKVGQGKLILSETPAAVCKVLTEFVKQKTIPRDVRLRADEHHPSPYEATGASKQSLNWCV